MEAIERFNQDVHYEIDQKCDDLPDSVRLEAKEIYDESINHDIAWSRPERHFATAAVYFACRTHGLPYTMRDLKREDDDISNITRTFRTICAEKGEVPDQVDPKAFVDRIHRGMGAVSDDIVEKAKEIIDEADGSTVSGKQANTIAASAYYVATLTESINITQEMIGGTVNVSSVAIRNTYRQLA